MKKSYEKPEATLISMSFDEHIAASGDIPSGHCGWDWANYQSAMVGGCTQQTYGDAI